MLSFAQLLKVHDAFGTTGGPGWASVLETMPGWFWETDAEYRLMYVSEGFERHTGLRREDLVNVCILDRAFGVDAAEAGLSEYHETLRAREPVEEMLYERIMVSGDRAVFLDSAHPKFDKAGRFLGYRGMTFYLSQVLSSGDRKLGVVADLKVRADTLEAMLGQRNKELEHSNAVMSEVLHAMGEGLLVTSGAQLNVPTNRVLFVNPEYLSLFGFAPHELYPGRPVRDAVRLLAERGEIDLTAFSSIDDMLGTLEGGKMHLRGSGRTLYVKAARRPNGGYVLLHMDVTEMETRTIMLEKARRAADVANEAKSNFLAAMSHEIRTPMNGIVGMIDLLELTDLDSEQLDYLATIRSSALALTALISDILDFSKVEAGRLEVARDPTALRALCQEVIALMRPLAEQKGLELVFHMSGEVPEHVRTDHARLRQVLVNLLGNAIKFTLSGSVRLALRGADPTRISVEDTGIGIPADKLDRIFHPFEQAQGGLQRQFEGTGLGLAITRKIVEAMQGEIAVESCEGQGTVFAITLPLARSDPPVRATPGTGPPQKLSQVHVLVAEDNRTNQVVAQRLLQRLGVTCQLASNGKEAVAAFEAERFDAILMDLSMPKLNGLDACRLIRRIEAEAGRPALPIIALTGNAFEQDKRAAEAAGMTGFLSKPIQLRTLGEELARHFPGAAHGDESGARGGDQSGAFAKGPSEVGALPAEEAGPPQERSRAR